MASNKNNSGLNFFPVLCSLTMSVMILFIINVILTVYTRLVVHPNYPHLSVPNATISSITISNHATVAVECNATLILTNPNHFSAVYDQMEVSLVYTARRARLAQFYTNPFVLPQMNSSSIEIGFGIQSFYLGRDVVKALKKDVESGSLRLEMRVGGLVSWKKFRARPHFLTVYCKDLVFRFTGSRREVGVLQSAGRECLVYVY